MLGGNSTKYRSISRFWLRRLCESVLFISALIIGLYAWARFMPSGLDLALGMAVSDATAITATAVCVITTVLCLWLPQKHTDIIALAVYFMAVALVSLLIFTSGGTDSPFISAWLAVSLFAGFFGIGAVGFLVVLAVANTTLSYFNQPMDLPILVGHAVLGLAPIILGAILWHRQPSSKKSNDSFRDLANKLSSVEGKSDIVINSIDDGVVSIDRTGIIDLINPAAETLLGWNQGDALGLDWRSVFKLCDIEGRDIDETENPIAQSLLTNQPVHNDNLQLITNGEKRRMVSIVSSPIGQNDGGIIIVFRDITKEKAEEREQAEFISTASHEMRTPVASIEGYLGLALNPATAQIDEKARDYITKAHESARHLGELFQNLLDISKSEDGRLKSNPEVIDVASLMANIFSDLEPIAREKGLRYIYKPSPSLDVASTERKLQPVFYVFTDPSFLREVSANLIENAIKYTPNGDIIVDVTGDDKFVTISIQDSGVGIPAEDLPHLFQKFYRVDNTDTREIGGTGLGLYLCRRLAEAMGGGIRVESVYKQGSTFFLDIPRISHEDAMEKISEASEAQPTITKDSGHRLSIGQAPQAFEATVIESTPQPQPQPQPTITPTAQPAEPLAQHPTPQMVQPQPAQAAGPQSTYQPAQVAAQQQVIQPTPATPQQPAEVVMPQTIEVTQTSGTSLEFKIPEQFQNLPFQEMSLADLDSTVRAQPVFENSGFQPLNVLPNPVQQPAQAPQQPTAATYPQPQSVQQLASRYAQFDQASRATSVSVPPRVQQ